MMDGLSAEEFAEWQLYDAMYMLPDRRIDQQLAALTYMQCGDKKAKLKDFMIEPPETKQQTGSQQAMILAGIAASNRTE